MHSSKSAQNWSPGIVVDISKIDPNDPCSTQDGAAWAAVTSITDEKYEWGGWIRRISTGLKWLYGGQETFYDYTPPRTDYQQDAVWAGPKPLDAVADYHGHLRIPGYKYNVPSPDDYRVVRFWGVDGYVMTPDRNLVWYQ